MEQQKASRELLVVAMTMEDESQRFYRELAGLSSNPRVKEFCLAMASDEVRHCRYYYRMNLELSATLQSSPISEGDFEAYIEDVRKLAKGEKDAVARVNSLGEHGALILAIEREKQTVEFYEGLLKSFPQHADTINQVIREEDGHVERLEDLAALVSKLA